MNNKQTSKFLFISAGTLTLIGAFTKLFDITYAPYIFSAGAVLLIFCKPKVRWIIRMPEDVSVGLVPVDFWLVSPLD